MIVRDCLGAGGAQAQALCRACGEVSGTVLLLQLGSAPVDPYERWVTAGVIAVIEELRALQRTSDSQLREANPVTVLCAGVCDPAAPAEALFEAVRGVVQSVTLESAAQSLRCNALRAQDPSDERVAAALRYLASPEGGFALGSTLDLAGAR